MTFKYMLWWHRHLIKQVRCNMCYWQNQITWHILSTNHSVEDKHGCGVSTSILAVLQLANKSIIDYHNSIIKQDYNMNQSSNSRPTRADNNSEGGRFLAAATRETGGIHDPLLSGSTSNLQHGEIDSQKLIQEVQRT
jgi:hypothetical protein